MSTATNLNKKRFGKTNVGKRRIDVWWLADVSVVYCWCIIVLVLRWCVVVVFGMVLFGKILSHHFFFFSFFSPLLLLSPCLL